MLELAEAVGAALVLPPFALDILRHLDRAPLRGAYCVVDGDAAPSTPGAPPTAEVAGELAFELGLFEQGACPDDKRGGKHHGGAARCLSANWRRGGAEQPLHAELRLSAAKSRVYRALFAAPAPPLRAALAAQRVQLCGGDAAARRAATRRAPPPAGGRVRRQRRRALPAAPRARRLPPPLARRVFDSDAARADGLAAGGCPARPLALATTARAPSTRCGCAGSTARRRSTTCARRPPRRPTPPTRAPRPPRARRRRVRTHNPGVVRPQRKVFAGGGAGVDTGYVGYVRQKIAAAAGARVHSARSQRQRELARDPRCCISPSPPPTLLRASQIL